MKDHISAKQLEMKYINIPVDGTVITMPYLLQYNTTDKILTQLKPKV